MSEISYVSRKTNETRKDSFKQYMKIWAALCKYIRGQCNKDKIIDTQLFGTFCKKSVLEFAQTQEEPNN